MSNSHNILAEVSNFVIHTLNEFIPKQLYFHNLSHTKDVVKAVKEIGDAQKINKDEMEMIEIAAWFHDIGYCSIYQGHEKESIAIATEFLKKKNYPLKRSEYIVKLIESTQYPQNPKNINEMVICDADLYHFSSEDYINYEQRLRKEWADYLGKKFTDKDWLRLNYELLFSHHYFTDYGQTALKLRK